MAGGVNADGTKVQIWDCTSGNANQRGPTTPPPSARPARPRGRCLDATGQSSADGTALQIWSCTTNANQKWTLPA
ncbi:hypothetical protein GCM10020220_099230 [Nonomuraea rubra]